MLDLWGRRWLSAQGLKADKLPDAITIPRPADLLERQEQKKIETDPAKIREFFARYPK